MYIPYPKNISKNELQHSSTALSLGLQNSVPAEYEINLVQLAWFLQKVRDELKAQFGKELPIIITSGFRSPELNSVIHGSRTSAHLRGHAADIKVPGLSTVELARFIDDHLTGFDQVIEEFGRWVHVGLSDHPRGQVLKATRGYARTEYTPLDEPEVFR